jgi:hypothetical protein
MPQCWPLQPASGRRSYNPMQTFTQALVPVAVGVVFIVLVAGLWNMMRGGSPNTSQKMMRARVIAQFVAIMVAMAALWLASR